MTESGGEFTVDLADLEFLISQLGGLIESVDRSMSMLDAQAKSMKSCWTGEAADAYTVAHAAWLSGAAELIGEITDAKARLRNAQTHFADSIAANLRMLGRG